MARPRILLVPFVCVLLSACATVSQQDYANNQPEMDVRNFFDGELSAHGIVKNRGGKVIRYFNARIEASWSENTGTLDETFYFDDGEVQKRVWTLVTDDKGQITGSANDVIGSSPLRVYGNSLFLEYVLRVPYDEDSIDLTIDDRMYRVSEDIVINESRMSKWGFDVGQIILVIRKLG